ncbi:DUF883 family protein [Stenotrophobium rhamnosiphilum]|uniref:DUF883 domain-containing protein n=1 Tax=Stenotrophobium rhamnosiphilum TaxID=2029166 RepID=A0A2T5MDB3_9GAMM|nr:DUF883 family protein [Stenotrophobium rhamnosiphilum]PTU30559.1 DUF883 domain-containing protein [Stenotrophobium rhamnosiphilum]
MEDTLVNRPSDRHNGNSNSTSNSASSNSGVGTAVKAVGGSSSALSREFHNFVSDIEDLIKSSTSLSGDELKKAKDKIQERIGTAKEALDSAAQGVMQRGRAAATATNEYVNHEPWKAVGIGAALGLLLGVLVARR